MTSGVIIYVVVHTVLSALIAVIVARQEDRLNAAGQPPVKRQAGEFASSFFAVMAVYGLALLALEIARRYG